MAPLGHPAGKGPLWYFERLLQSTPRNFQSSGSGRPKTRGCSRGGLGPAEREDCRDIWSILWEGGQRFDCCSLLCRQHFILEFKIIGIRNREMIRGNGRRTRYFIGGNVKATGTIHEQRGSMQEQFISIKQHRKSYARLMKSKRLDFLDFFDN